MDDESVAPNANKVFDVAKPNQTPASATSRPVIVGHGISQKDPMVDSSAKPSDIEKPKRELNLTPINTGVTAEDSAIDAKPESATGVVANAEPSSTALVDEIVSNVNTKKDRIDQADLDARKEQEIQALIDSKQYFVKVGTAASRRNMQWLILLIIIATAGAAGWYFYFGPGASTWKS